jgi:hypothetical protein
LRIGEISSRAGRPDAGGTQHVERFRKSRVPKIQDVIVRERAHINACGREARDVLEMHPVVNAFARPIGVAGRDTRFEVDDSGVRRYSVQFRERVTPDVGGIDRPPNWAIDLLGEIDVVARVAHRRLMQIWRVWMPQNLIDSSPRHHVAAEE